MSRATFWQGLRAVEEACDEPAVKSSTPVGEILRRGLTISVFNLLEAFIADRLEELATHCNSGHLQFLDLPDRMQERAIRQTLRVATRRIQREKLNISDLRNFAKVVGLSLTGVETNLKLSPMMWSWEGSNISVDDYLACLSYMHLGSVWDNIRKLSGRLGFEVVDSTGDPINLQEDFRSLVRDRNNCAHVASYPITNIQLRAFPNRVLRYAVSFDIFASMGAHLIRNGNADYLRDKNWLASEKVTLQFVRQRRRDYGEYMEGALRAKRVLGDGDELFRTAISRAKDMVAVVKQDRSLRIVDWSIRAVG